MFGKVLKGNDAKGDGDLGEEVVVSFGALVCEAGLEMLPA